MLFPNPFPFTKEGIQKFINVRSQEYLEKVKTLQYTPRVAIYHDNTEPASEKYVKNKLKRFEYYGIKPYITNNSILFNDQAIHLNTPTFIQQPHSCKKKLTVCNDCEGFSAIDIKNQLLGSKDFTLWPCTAKGIYEHLEWALGCNFIKEKPHVVIVGRSDLVGKPLARLLLANDYTVSVIHSKTDPFMKKMILTTADVIVSATGNRGWMGDIEGKLGSIPVYDVGINFEDGHLCGDIVNPTAWCTPVPYGVGKLTVEALCWNIIDWYVNKRNEHYERYPR